MSHENHVVADFYARLWPWIDHTQPMQVMLDDGGKGAAATPDLCFCFLGSQRPLRIEFKILDKRINQIEPTTKQLATWGDATAGPHLWIAKRADEPRYLFWRHDDPTFLAAFSARATAGTTRRAVAPPTKAALSLPQVFAKVLAYAESEGFLA